MGGQLGYKVGQWEHFNEDNQVKVTHQGGRNYKLWFPRSLSGSLRNHKMLIMHQKRAIVGVMADNVQGLTVSHLKFGSFGGAALNFKRVKDPTLYALKCQPIHNHRSVKRTAWATCNDLGWLRNPYGKVNARKTTCMQQTDDCLNFHVFTPRVDEAEHWFWNEWCNWGDTLLLYKPNGEFNKKAKCYGSSTPNSLPG